MFRDFFPKYLSIKAALNKNQKKKFCILLRKNGEGENLIKIFFFDNSNFPFYHNK